MRNRSTFLLTLFAVIVAVPALVFAQVTTATLYGTVRDSSGGIVPGATVVVTNEGTGVARQSISDERGEFVLSALTNGTYTIKIDLQGFKTRVQKGMELGAGQTVRETFSLELGTLAETVVVESQGPLVQAATSSQSTTLSSQLVNELPVSRRNVTNILSLAPGVTTSGSGSVQMNGVAAGGTGVTVDGTEANSNPEARSLSQYGGQNQIDVMSIDAIAEVQIIKGVLPAEFGGVAGGQVNMISRSGTNTFRGSTFWNFQNQRLNTRSPTLPGTTATPKALDNFNQYGGSLGGPLLKNKVFFFATYEGYQEKQQQNLTGTVPYQATRDALLKALPFPETQIVLDTLPMPTEPIVSAQGVVNPDVGRYRGLGEQVRHENHVVVKGDMALFNGANLAVTYTRLRPYTESPTIHVDRGNYRQFPNFQDRVATQFVFTNGRWVSESRFGYNHTYLARLDAFLGVMDPKNSTEIMNYGRRVGLISIQGNSGFGTPSSEIYDLTGGALSFDQKFSRGIDRHLFKAGFRWQSQNGNRQNPQNPGFTYQTMADALANIPNQINISFGAPKHKSNLDEYGFFLQDDWRIGGHLVLNLGLRYDYYATIKVHPTTEVPVEIVNLAPFTSLDKLDFGGVVDPLNPYRSDGNNVAPRVGFAWSVPHMSDTVIRGGSGMLFSPHLPATVRESAANPFVPFRTIWIKAEAVAKGLKWPMYTDDAFPIVQRDANGQRAVFSVFNTNLPVPYTVQSMLSVERGFGKAMALEVGYLRTDGRDFPLQDPFPQAFDRETGLRPNPALGAPGGYYVSSDQKMEYNALQVSFRKRFSHRYSYDVGYTLGKGEATQGGDLAAYYLASIGNTQDFFHPELDYGPVDNDIRHRLNTSFIYELPDIRGGKGFLNGAVGGWQLSGIYTARTGGALTITQPSGIGASRPDVVPGESLVLDDYETTYVRLNTAAFARVPVITKTNATSRAGTYIVGMVRSTSTWNLNMSLAKNFRIGSGKRLQIRIDAFNALNHHTLGNPNTNITSTDFGRITGIGGTRTAQVGAKFNF
jgi:outer membrane receptor protein involved in Fe transport